MLIVRVMLTLVFAFFMTCAVQNGAAQCYQYTNIQFDCSGQNCAQTITLSLCDIGCHAGMCVGNGNTRECCGSLIHYAQASQPCHDCSQFPIRFHIGSSNSDRKYRAELMQGYTAGVVMLSPTKNYMPPELVETYSRCGHSYSLTVREGRVFAIEGM